jgi:hypothetical protein
MGFTLTSKPTQPKPTPLSTPGYHLRVSPAGAASRLQPSACSAACQTALCTIGSVSGDLY